MSIAHAHLAGLYVDVRRQDGARSLELKRSRFYEFPMFNFGDAHINMAAPLSEYEYSPRKRTLKKL